MYSFLLYFFVGVDSFIICWVGVVSESRLFFPFSADGGSAFTVSRGVVVVCFLYVWCISVCL